MDRRLARVRVEYGKSVHALAYTNKRVDELNAKAVQYIDGYDITTDPYRYRIGQQRITQEGGYTKTRKSSFVNTI